MNSDLLWFILENDLVFDIGANHGLNTAKYLEKKCKVISVEPQPNCIKTLQEKFKNDDKITILQKAVSDNNGISKFCLCGSDTLSTMVPEKWKSGRFRGIHDNWDNFIAVETVTLDNLIKQYGIPKFCKIDVEGYEYEVLNGLNIPIPCISFEYTYEFLQDAHKCLDRLHELGFKNFNITDSVSYIFDEMISIDDIKNINFNNLDAWGDIYAFSDLISNE